VAVVVIVVERVVHVIVIGFQLFVIRQLAEHVSTSETQ
jgi:hypothetical protein